MLFTKLLPLLVFTGPAFAAATPARSLHAREEIQPNGTYMIENAKSGTVVDLSGTDNTSIIGYPLTAAKTKKWSTIWTGENWNIQSVSTGSLHTLGISCIDELNATDFRIYSSNTTETWDLYNYGDPTPGDPITLWGAWAAIHQTWNFISSMLLSAFSKILTDHNPTCTLFTFKSTI
ncbi:hypothetical protein BDP27DRAFT_1348006 [Rhodocollybia butyracea]|uniref:Ricin B lectin domain-containing protein n=1 Tax=Rhodocollybia butyracea TaxID=206335 RepID=A0A9P5P5S4_9AGAR|nr:hypothetical protein BDP27DRAFT_1348006 [Rhodocollybia butyracea]